MPTIETNYRVARALYMLLYGTCNITQAIATSGRGNPKIERLLCYLQQTLHLWSNSSYGNSNRRVRMPAIITGSEIDRYNVTFFENTLTGNPMHNFFVYRRTERS